MRQANDDNNEKKTNKQTTAINFAQLLPYIFTSRIGALANAVAGSQVGVTLSERILFPEY